MGKGSRLQPSTLGEIAVGTVQGEPDCLESIGVVAPAWENVPVQMGDLIAERFDVEFQRSEFRFDRTAQTAGIVDKSEPLRVIEMMQFADMTTRNQNAVAGVVLPRSQKRHGVGELRNDIGDTQPLKLFAQRARHS